MAKEISEDVKEIKKAIEEGKAIIGSKLTLKGLKAGDVKKVYLCSNCPEDTKADITRYAQISGASVVQLQCPNSEFGTICRKPFSVSVVGV